MSQYGVVSDFILSVEIEVVQPSEHASGLVIVFGYQDESNFYFLNLTGLGGVWQCVLSQVTPGGLVKVPEQFSMGSMELNRCHLLKLERQVITGNVRFYMDDMDRPVLAFVDTTLQHGEVGMGLHHDTALKREPEIKAVRASRLSPNE